MTKLYLSELKAQLDVVKDRLRTLENRAPQSAYSDRFRECDKEEAVKLAKRKREIEQRIIFYED